MSGVRPGHTEFTRGLAIDSSSSSSISVLNLLRTDRGQTGDQGVKFGGNLLLDSPLWCKDRVASLVANTNGPVKGFILFRWKFPQVPPVASVQTELT